MSKLTQKISYKVFNSIFSICCLLIGVLMFWLLTIFSFSSEIVALNVFLKVCKVIVILFGISGVFSGILFGIFTLTKSEEFWDE